MGRKKTNKWKNRGDFYRENEYLGAESRATEFKNGPAFIEFNFRENVAKYVCGFINSQENGKLLIGVNDAGLVSGFSCNHQQEDSLRCEVDKAVKDLHPPIFPKDYRVRFVPVLNEHNQQSGNAKVIEIIVFGARIGLKDQLYCNKQRVFMRRDGSIQELKANEIQEWNRRYNQIAIDKLKNNERNLQTELQNQKNKLRQMEKELQQNNEELQRQKSLTGHMLDEKRQLQDENNHLQQANDQGGAQGGSELVKRVDKIQQMLEEQGKKEKHSKVCIVI